uniref:non-specific serine/threonine protein kinase n=1 Tax=Haptolina ericina TaxID=156174 RepID=A0A7S3AJ13_9EUKA
MAAQLKGVLVSRIAQVQALITKLDSCSTSPLLGHETPLPSLRCSINDFDLQRLLSRGASSRVWLVRKRVTADVFALKAIKIKRGRQKEEQRVDVRVEQQILMSHSSSFLVKCFFSFYSAQHVFFALEFMPGGDLAAMLSACGCVQEAATRFYVAEVAEGLRYLHSHNVIHRDIKPANVLIAASGHVKLADFGLSTSRSRRKRCGTLPYIAPEGLREVDILQPTGLDLWALGVLLYELIVGVLPFHGDTPEEFLADIERRSLQGQGVFVPPAEVFASLSPSATQLCQALLAHDPAERLGVDSFASLSGCPFFIGIDWDRLLEMAPPFVPDLISPTDAQYFNGCCPPVDTLPSFAGHFPPSVEASPHQSGRIGSRPDASPMGWRPATTVNVEQLLSLTR